ncbi:serine/threonine protein kinase [Streptomyces oryzae]|uniref:Serine/threonine protein kinase n=1 Tax=Streptomyces oryzae TaxID=1434886 RepID=A0ABS3XGS7_9ACTN|nr:serine/threonine-protein kinase [Streptomyces oryzae]MBO8194316.1 serine/threonine protein kinase [Streptomyces oryzae]
MKSLRADDPERIGDYRLLGRLGEGGMGSVYLAQSPRGRTVAVKLVRRELAEDAEFRNRFEQEVGAARRVGGEWTAPVLDADTEADPPWLATGYIPGITLYEAVAGRATPLPVRTLRILANRLARALGAIHEAGLVHRDVKPSNILVTIDGPRVIDFGIARALETVADAQLTRTGAVVGSPGFMSPEQVRGDRVTEASDIFSLGSVLTFAATGRAPFERTGVAGHVQMYRIAQEEPDLEDVPEELRELVAGCLAKDGAERPELTEILERTADPEDEPGPGASGSEAAEPWLPGSLVAQLGRHAARLLDAEVPGARAAAERAAEAPALPPRPGAEPSLPGAEALAEGAGSETPPEGTGTSAESAERSGEQPLPPPPPAPGGPEMHGMMTVTDAAAQHAPTSGQLPPPPSPPAPQGGPGAHPAYALHGPAAAAAGPERRHRRGMVLGALGVVLALVSGVGTFVALRLYDSSGDDAKQSGPQAKSSPGADSDTSKKPSPKDISSPAPGGALPKGYLGAWQGSVQDADGSTVTRRFEIRQGEEGEVIARTVNVRADMMCEGEATLVAFDGGDQGLRVTSRITDSHPASRPCSPYKEQTLKLRTDGTLSWVYPDSSLSATLRKVGDPAAPVPARMAGEWKGTNPQGEERTLTIHRGRVGTATVRVSGDYAGDSCEWEHTLGGADGETLLYGPDEVVESASGPSCAGSATSLMISAAGDDELRVSSVREPDGAPRVYRRAGSE